VKVNKREHKTFHVKRKSNTTYVLYNDADVIVGEIFLETKRKLGKFVYSARLDQKLHNLGLGRFLYESILLDFGQLSTEFHNITTHAKRVWLSLIRQYDFSFDFFRGHLTVYNRPRDKNKKVGFDSFEYQDLNVKTTRQLLKKLKYNI
jgi:hypothetical protein